MGTMTYTPIATTTLGSAASSITFSSIPSTYTDLRLVLVGSSASVWVNKVRFNSDAGTNYSYTVIAGDGTSASSSRSTNLDSLFGYTPMYATPSLRTYDIFNYAGSTYKTVLYSESNDLNGSGYVSNQVCLWRSTAAINTILIFASGNMDAGTRATLYGIRAA